ncbi:MAG: hypothetical protein MPJ50_05730 [Pirellulales bacterium]|nr:hypothetical protein [Pirellulales bacterium]
MSTRYDYVLWSETDDDQGAWRFVLRSVDGRQAIDADEIEPEIRGERLQLLAIVRGLEALDRPAKIALVTRSRYIYRGLTYGLQQWRSQGWMWESYGRMTPVKNADLWKRLDRAATIHGIECRTPAAIRHVRRNTHQEHQPLRQAESNRRLPLWRRAVKTAGHWIGNVAAAGKSRQRRLVCE